VEYGNNGPRDGPSKVNFNLLGGASNIPFPMNMVVDKVCHLLVLDVNGLLCGTTHVKFSKKWKPLVPPMRCGNKLISPQPQSWEFLELCNSRFEIGIWSSTMQPNLKPMVQFLLGEGSGIKPKVV
jgi:hypothetical protein